MDEGLHLAVAHVALHHSLGSLEVDQVLKLGAEREILSLRVYSRPKRSHGIRDFVRRYQATGFENLELLVMMVVAEILGHLGGAEDACWESGLCLFAFRKDRIVLVIIAPILQIMLVVHERLGTFLDFGVETSGSCDLLGLRSEHL